MSAGATNRSERGSLVRAMRSGPRLADGGERGLREGIPVGGIVSDAAHHVPRVEKKRMPAASVGGSEVLVDQPDHSIDNDRSMGPSGDVLRGHLLSSGWYSGHTLTRCYSRSTSRSDGSRSRLCTKIVDVDTGFDPQRGRLVRVTAPVEVACRSEPHALGRGAGSIRRPARNVSFIRLMGSFEPHSSRDEASNHLDVCWVTSQQRSEDGFYNAASGRSR